MAFNVLFMSLCVLLDCIVPFRLVFVLCLGRVGEGKGLGIKLIIPLPY